MSKIANRTILIPANTQVEINKNKMSFTGPVGKYEGLIIPHDLEIIKEDNIITTRSLVNPAIAGTYNSLITNFLQGVSVGFQDFVEVKGVGYKAALKGDKLELIVGKSHPVEVDIPTNLEVKVEGNRIVVKGVDKQAVSNFIVNKIVKHRLPDVYKKNKGMYRSGKETPVKASKLLNK
jgi:large subunit ribosomal protein L6